jgi:MIOREX complex component 7
MYSLPSSDDMQLLASPAFHRAVRRVHKKVHEVRHGEKLYDPAEMGGTQIDSRFWPSTS